MTRRSRWAAVEASSLGLRERVGEWRRTGDRPGAMPAELWAEAISLARVHGAYGVARAVGVSYWALRRRVELGRDSGSKDGGAWLPADETRESTKSGFVEVRGPWVDQPAVTGDAVIELAASGGRRMTIRVGPLGSLDVARVVRAFWSSGG